MKKRLLAVAGAVALATVLAMALMPGATVLAQATRTWVSGVGDDVNPCSRTAPCKTFAGAISKTAAGGEINCLDPGGFGALTIIKSITIKCQYTEGGILAAGTNGIIISAAATDRITLRGLDINGGPSVSPGLVGIKINSAATVHIIDTEVYQFKAGIVVASTVTLTRVYIGDSHIHNNAIGVIVGPGSAANVGGFATIRHSAIVDNGCNLVASSTGTNGSVPTPTDCGTAASPGFNKVAQVNVYDSAISDATVKAVFSRGANAIARLGGNNINGNAVGLSVQDGGTTRSHVDNQIDGNGSTIPPTTNVPTT